MKELLQRNKISWFQKSPKPRKECKDVTPIRLPLFFETCYNHSRNNLNIKCGLEIYFSIASWPNVFIVSKKRNPKLSYYVTLYLLPALIKCKIYQYKSNKDSHIKVYLQSRMTVNMKSYASIHVYIFRILKYKTLTIKVINISLPLYTQIIGIFGQQHSTETPVKAQILRMQVTSLGCEGCWS